jgi:hypothetical protein
MAPVAGGGIVVRPQNGSDIGVWLWVQPANNDKPTRMVAKKRFMGVIG